MTKKNKIFLSKPLWPKEDKFWNFWYILNAIVLNEFKSYKTLAYNTSPGLAGKTVTERIVRLQSAQYDLFIAYHLLKRMTKCIDYKMAYFPSTFYFDNGGYAGFSEICSQNLLSKIPDKRISDAFYENRILPLISETKYDLHNIAKIENNIPDQFIFLPLQVQNDTVMGLAEITTNNMIGIALETASSLGLPVVIKAHPKSQKKCRVFAYCKDLAQTYPSKIFISNGDIRDLLDKSTAIFVVNSGTGFEGLIRMKPVFTYGKSDYQQATYHNYRSIVDITNAINNGINQEKIKVFLYNWWQHIIDIRDPDHYFKIKNKIENRLK